MSSTQSPSEAPGGAPGEKDRVADETKGDACFVQEVKERIVVVICFRNEDDGTFPMNLIQRLCQQTQATYRLTRLKARQREAEKGHQDLNGKTKTKNAAKRKHDEVNMGELMQSRRFLHDQVTESIGDATVSKDALSDAMIGEEVILIVVMADSQGKFPEEEIASFCRAAKANCSYSHLNIMIKKKRIKREN